MSWEVDALTVAIADVVELRETTLRKHGECTFSRQLTRDIESLWRSLDSWVRRAGQ